jgi:hypothetical protein
MPFRAASAILLPNGDLIVARAGEAGGLFRLTAAATAFQQLTGVPADAGTLYRTGGWLVAAPVWDQRETPDLDHLAYASPDNGISWVAVPKP